MSIKDNISKARENTGGALATTSQLMAQIERFRPNLQRALPGHMTVDYFLSLVSGAVSKNPDIALCEAHTILQSVADAARMGLAINISGQGFLVPYNDNRNNRKVCQFIPGWQGLVDLVNRSGRGVVKTGAVFDGDFFEYDLGLESFLRHRNDGDEMPDKLLYTYAIGFIKGENGWTPPPIIEVWKVRKVEMHLEHYNKVGKNHYALKDGNNWIQYARKLPLLQVLKYMPKSAEIAKAVEAANKADSGEAFTLDGDFTFTSEGGVTGGGGGGGGGGNAAAGNTSGEPKKETFAELAERVKKAANRDAALLIVDASRHLPADQAKDLIALVDKQFAAK